MKCLKKNCISVKLKSNENGFQSNLKYHFLQAEKFLHCCVHTQCWQLCNSLLNDNRKNENVLRQLPMALPEGPSAFI